MENNQNNLNNDDAISNEISLGGDIFDSTENKISSELGISENKPSEIKIEKSVSIDELYELLVKPFKEIQKINRFDEKEFKNFIKLGNIPAATIYKIAGLGLYQIGTDEDRKRIHKWCEEWIKESKKFERTDIEISEDLNDAIPCFEDFFRYEIDNEDLNKSLKKVAWANLETLIKDKCSDKIVELEELVSIKQAAIEHGILNTNDEKSKENFKNELEEKINSYNAKIDTIQVAFIRFYEERSKKDSTLTLDTNASKTELIEEFQRLRNLQIELNPEDSSKFTDFNEFLSECNISLKNKVEFFEEDYFDDFKKHVKLNQLQQSIFKGTKKLAMCREYGFTETDWEDFVKKHKINPISDEELIKMNQRNGIIKNSLKVAGCVACLAVLFLLFRVCFPNQFTYIVSKIAPSEEQKALNLANQKAKAEQELALAQAKAEQERLIAEEKANREREEYEEQKRREQAIEDSKPKTYTVGIGDKYNFKNLQDAINASKDTDTIILSPGIYKSTANINKKITITSTPAIVSSIKTKYFASKDVPIIVLDSKSSSKISADVKISGVVFTNNPKLSFTTFSNYLDTTSTFEKKSNANVSKSGLKWTKFTEDPVNEKYRSLFKVTANVDFEGVVFADSEQDGIALTSNVQNFDGCYFINIMNNAILSIGNAKSTFKNTEVHYTVCGSGFRIKENSLVKIDNATLKKCHNGIFNSGSANSSAENLVFDSCVIASIRSDANSNMIFKNVAIKNNLLKGSVGIAIDGNSISNFETLVIQNSYAGIVVAGKSNPTFSNFKISDSTTYGVCFTENVGGNLNEGEIFGGTRGIVIQKKAAPLISKIRIHNTKEAGITSLNNSKGHISQVEAYSNATGFSINDNTKPVIVNSKAYLNNNGFLSSENNEAIISNSESYKNLVSGFAVFESGSANFKANNIIDGCKFYQNEGDGIVFRGNTTGTIINTISMENLNQKSNASGLLVDGNSKVTVSNSEFIRNNFGTRFLKKSAGYMNNSKCNENLDSGAIIDGESVVDFDKCTFNKNMDGFYTKVSSKSYLSECSIIENTNVGLTLKDSSTGVFKNCKIKKNVKKDKDNKSKAKQKPEFDNNFSTYISNLF